MLKVDSSPFTPPDLHAIKKSFLCILSTMVFSPFICEQILEPKDMYIPQG